MADGACREATDTSRLLTPRAGPYNGHCLSSSNREIPMHVTSGRWLYGFLLALTTTLLWGVLPIMLKQDRKSTRLNSSHVRISYAVFCLKKKKKNTYTKHYNKKEHRKASCV